MEVILATTSVKDYKARKLFKIIRDHRTSLVYRFLPPIHVLFYFMLLKLLVLAVINEGSYWIFLVLANWPSGIISYNP
jgi:hypothetical protein